MSENDRVDSKAQALVMWVIWFAILQGAFVFQWLLSKEVTDQGDLSEPMALWLWALCLIPIVFATLIRWLVIPQLFQPQQKLVAMILGLSFSEAPVFCSLFLMRPEYPNNQIVVLIVAICSIIQFAPSYGTPGYHLEGEAS